MSLTIQNKLTKEIIIHEVRTWLKMAIQISGFFL